MNVALVGQLFTGVLLAGGSITIGTIILRELNPEWFGKFGDIQIYATSKDTVINASSDTAPGAVDQSKDIKCNLEKENNDSKDKLSCVVNLTTTSSNINTQKNTYTSSFSQKITETTEIKENSYYKITLNKKFWADWSEKNTNKIQIFKGSTKAGKDLTPLFILENNKVIWNKFQQQTTYLVGNVEKISSAEGVTATETTTITKSNKTDENYVCYALFDLMPTHCKIYNVASTKQSKITENTKINFTFQQPQAVVDQIEDGNFYLIENNASFWPEKIGNNNDADKNKKMKLTDIKSAIYIDEILFIIW